MILGLEVIQGMTAGQLPGRGLPGDGDYPATIDIYRWDGKSSKYDLNIESLALKDEVFRNSINPSPFSVAFRRLAGLICLSQIVCLTFLGRLKT